MPHKLELLLLGVRESLDFVRNDFLLSCSGYSQLYGEHSRLILRFRRRIISPGGLRGFLGHPAEVAGSAGKWSEMKTLMQISCFAERKLLMEEVSI